MWWTNTTITVQFEIVILKKTQFMAWNSKTWPCCPNIFYQLANSVFISQFFSPLRAEREQGSCVNSQNEMKVIRVMLPWTSRPIMAWLTFTQPLQAKESPSMCFLSQPHSVSLSAASRCQIESVPTPQAWGNRETSLPFCMRLFSSSPSCFFPLLRTRKNYITLHIERELKCANNILRQTQI